MKSVIGKLGLADKVTRSFAVVEFHVDPRGTSHLTRSRDSGVGTVGPLVPEIFGMLRMHKTLTCFE
jgi:hypothetical protein